MHIFTLCGMSRISIILKNRKKSIESGETILRKHGIFAEIAGPRVQIGRGAFTVKIGCAAELLVPPEGPEKS